MPPSITNTAMPADSSRFAASSVGLSFFFLPFFLFFGVFAFFCTLGFAFFSAAGLGLFSAAGFAFFSSAGLGFLSAAGFAFGFFSALGAPFFLPCVARTFWEKSSSGMSSAPAAFFFVLLSAMFTFPIYGYLRFLVG